MRCQRSDLLSLGLPAGEEAGRPAEGGGEIGKWAGGQMGRWAGRKSDEEWKVLWLKRAEFSHIGTCRSGNWVWT
ncbi:hypothetical protein SBA2_10071 [Acidobacteriia bacterium SbA2]|nr:hypothetical protein SBA2_10071 [Acidobacteriia bacterium SbA2]